jgi:DNA recombination protein RmuC
MMAPILCLVAGIIIGVLLTLWLRPASAASATGLPESELTRLRQDAAARAGFESLAAERNSAIDKLSAELAEKSAILNTQSAEISRLQANLQNEQKNAAEKLKLLEDARDALSNQFKLLADDILKAKVTDFSTASQKELGTLLTPLREQLTQFKQKVEQVEKDSNTGVTRLETLIGSLKNLNQQLADEARSLSTALRGSTKSQGDWGEMIVRNLLEHAGLREGEHYREQVVFDRGAEAADGGRRKGKPDIIVDLPGDRHLIIDSKVTLNAYLEYVQSETDDNRKAAIKRLVAAMRVHIDELSGRRYQKLPGLETVDFVVMFVPIEPAFLLALYEDDKLWSYAYEKEVLLVGPSTLLFVIRIVNNLWEQEKQIRNVQAVWDRGSKLYEKFVGFVEDINAIGKNLEDASSTHREAVKKLTEGPGNLVRQVEMLRELGVKPSKKIPARMLESAGVEEAEPGTLFGSESK